VKPESSFTFLTFLSFFLAELTASDKCGIESECFSFDKYMRAATQLWMERTPAASTPTSIVVTTEARDVFRELTRYDTGGAPFPVQFVTNHHDVLQSTGFFDELDRAATNVTADEAMLSAMSSLKLQLATKITTGNCCSNFHLLIADFLRAGCGASNENTFQCLQDHSDPLLRPCCSWDQSDVCRERRINQTLSQSLDASS